MAQFGLPKRHVIITLVAYVIKFHDIVSQCNDALSIWYRTKYNG